MQEEQIILDPGIGFSKRTKENLEIISKLEELHSFKRPLYIGLSRKKFIGTILGEDSPQNRDIGTTVLHTMCLQKGVSYIRTHNVRYASQCVQMLNAVFVNQPPIR